MGGGETSRLGGCSLEGCWKGGHFFSCWTPECGVQRSPAESSVVETGRERLHAK